MLLPKTNLTLKELRLKAKAYGYKVKSQSVGFDGDERIVWHLVGPDNTHYFIGNVYPESKQEEVRKAFELTKALCNWSA